MGNLLVTYKVFLCSFEYGLPVEQVYWPVEACQNFLTFTEQTKKQKMVFDFDKIESLVGTMVSFIYTICIPFQNEDSSPFIIRK